ncbi:MAG: ApaG domain-containing protein, partial [Chlorobiales bacterium]|nr:ApaG domain-containing protein [Chlorobiales bacterium]
MSDICKVTIDRLDEIPELSIESPYKYGYAYTISIHNTSPYTIQIRSRKWIVRDGDMKDKVVEGEGVVGQTPIIPPGETYTYQSYHVMQSRYGNAQGWYYGTYTYQTEPNGALEYD